MKTTFGKFQPKFLSYRKCKPVFNDTFKDTILEQLRQVDGYNDFLKTC